MRTKLSIGNKKNMCCCRNAVTTLYCYALQL